MLNFLYILQDKLLLYNKVYYHYFLILLFFDTINYLKYYIDLELLFLFHSSKIHWPKIFSTFISSEQNIKMFLEIFSNYWN